MTNKTIISAIFLFVFLFSYELSKSQTPGLIFEPSTGTKLDGITKVLDPDGNGYISDGTGGVGFSSAVSATTPGNDVPEFEIPMHPFPTLGSGEALRDIRSGPDEGFTDFSINDDGTASYFYLDDENNFIFRFRLADYRPNAKGYTVLIDTDNKFGNNGDSDDDPNYTATNPGFEIAIMLRSKHEVSLIDIDGASTCGTVVKTFDLTTHHQKSISGIGPASDGDLDYFYDFYIPFDSITSYFTTHNESGGPVTTSTPLRMTATTNTSNTCAFEGSLSDVGGIDDSEFEGCLECLFEAIIEGQVPTDATSNVDYPAERTDCPEIEGSYPVGTVHIIGTAVPGAIMKFYLDGVEQASASVAADAITGAYTSGNFVTTSIGEVISVTATDTSTTPDKSESKKTCATSIVTATPECTNTSPVVTVATPNASGQSEVTTSETVNFTLTNAQNATLRFFSNGVDITGTISGTGSFGTPTSDGTTITWVFDMYSNEKVPCGTMSVTLEDNDNGLCPSTSALACNTAGSCKSAASSIPVISTSPITISTTSISGTSDANDGISLYVNDIGFATGTADGSGNWTISGLDLSNYLCKGITATANGSGECASSASDPAVIVEEISTSPTITDPPYCGTTTTIYGTSYESDGTTANEGALIQLYLNGSGTPETETAIVNSYGKWAITGLNLATGTSMRVTATEDDECQTESALSSAVTITGPSSNAGITITTSPIIESTTSISGEFAGSGTVDVYIDEVLLGTASIAGTTWTLNAIAAGDLYEGGKIQATQTTTGCESALSDDFELIGCSSTPSQPTLSPFTYPCTDLTNTSIDLTATGIESGFIYTLVDNNGDNLGISQYSAGTSNLVLATTFLPATPNPALIKVKAEKFSPILDCSVYSTNTLSIRLDVVDTTLTVNADNDTICNGSNTNINVELSKNDVTYSLRNGTTVIGLSQTGNGGTLTFNTGTLGSTTVFNIYAEDSLCSKQLEDTVKIVVEACAMPTVTLSTSPDTITENGGSSTITATLSSISASDVTVTLAYSGTAAGSGTDYTAASSTITITAGNTTGTTTITADNDAIYEGFESIIIDIDGVTNATENGTQQDSVIIQDDESLPTVTISTNPDTISENSGSSTITATLNHASTENITVTLAYSGTATGSGTDYTAASSTITITAGNTTGTTTVTADNDAVYEGFETIIIDIDGVTNATEDGTQQDSVIIQDDENLPTVTLGTNPDTISENSGSSTITATLNHASTENITVTLAYSGTATGSGTDYTAASSIITITAGNTTGTTTVTADNDAVYEGFETILIDIDGVTNASEDGIQKDSVIIQDDESLPTVTLSTSPDTISENSGNSTITATLSSVSASDVTVTLAFSGTAAGSGTDYTAASSTITITAGNTTGTTTVTADNDAVYEGFESIIIDIDGVTNATEDGTQQDSVIIEDDESLPTVTLSTSPDTISENSGSSTITATLNHASTENVAVTLAYSGTATGSGTDYTAASSTITITAGNTTGITTVTADNDAIYEGFETIIIDIDGVTNATENGTQQDSVIIQDDESIPTVTLSVSPTSIAENGASSTLTATLSHATTANVTVTLAYSGTATGSGTDYTAASSNITITAGNTTGTTTVTADDDAITEGNETIIVDIASVTNATEDGTQQATITITDNEGVPSVTLSVSPDTISENAGSSTITATLNSVSVSDVTVTLAFSGTAAGSGTDYTAASSTITITAGNTTGTTTVTADNDVIYEGFETIIIDIDAVTNASEDGTQQDSVIIQDDESLPTVTLSASPDTISENSGSSTITATLNHASTENVTVTLAYSGTATGSGTDYTAASSTISITAGNTTGNTTVTADNDAVYEGFETIIIDIDGVTNASEDGTQQDSVIIQDDESLPTVTLSASPTSIAENGASSTLTATLSHATTANVTVMLSYSGTATGSGTDYTAASSTITITAGNTTGTTTVTADDDAITEGNETIIIDIASVTNATEDGTQQETITITDNEGVPSVTLSVSPDTISESSGNSTITATLNSVSVSDVTVTLAFSGTATGSGTDYTVASSTITITAGNTTGTTTVTADNDAVYEGFETIIIDIDGVTNATEDGTQQDSVIIQDDEGIPTVTLNASPTSIAENGASSTLTATLSHATTSNVTVTLSYSGTATGSGTDYTAASSTITITAGNTTGTTTVTADDDLITEGNETIIVDIASVTNATEDGTQQATITITDNEGVPSVTLSVSPDTISENAGSSTITATLNSVSVSDVTVTLAFSGTAAGSGTDYTAASSTITITAGNTTGTTTVTADNDAMYEGFETIIIDIDGVTNASEDETQQDSVIIQDDENIPTVTLSASPTSIAENGASSTLTATLSHATTANVVVTLAYSGTATGGGTDYTAASSTITITAGNTTGTTTVTADDDLITEGNETIIVDITSITNATEDGTQQETITITDNEGVPSVTLSVSPDTIAENSGNSTITATLNSVSVSDVTVTLAFSGTATGSGTDYTAASSTITITAGNTTGTTTVTADNDGVYEGFETIIIDIDGVTNATEDGAQQDSVIIQDDEGIPTVTLNASPTSIAENGASSTLTATLSHTTTSNVTVTLSYSGTATGSGTDYTAASSNITITAGNTTGTTTVTADDDAITEGNETIIVDIASVTNATEDGTQQATITIVDDESAPANNAPNALNDTITINKGQNATGNLLSNDSDSDGDNLIIETTPVSGPSNGTLTINTDGTFSYTPNEGFVGTDSFEYRICDDGTPSQCAIASVSITIITNDKDNDGIPDSDEGNDDPDNDGIPSYEDTDSDNDSIPDINEGNNDSDKDGIPDYKDTDSDNDGIPDIKEGNNDTDKDGVPDYKDTDSDNDGIPDINEGNNDTDNDGIPDYKDTDSDGDGISDNSEGNLDTDNDGIPDYRDLDSDGDGINDNDEGSGDLDNDGIPDFRDTDSDNDGIDDIDEGINDCDNDGIPDYADPDQCNNIQNVKSPEGFSPNGDGVNDFFIIDGLDEFDKVDIKIFNRWGNIVFKQKDYQNNWDGNSNTGLTIGSELPVGTYFYFITIYDTNENISGYIYLNK